MTTHDTYAARYSADPADPSQAERLAAYSAGWDDCARTAASCAASSPLDPSTATCQERTWSCKIGGRIDALPGGSDAPMRQAVREAFERVTGYWPEFIFSGWGGTLTDVERSVVEGRARADVPEGCTPADARVLREANHALAIEVQQLRGALKEIALAGMSGTGQESPEGMRDWHAHRAWEFIRIAARALDAARTTQQGDER